VKLSVDVPSILYREALKTVGLNSLSWGGRSSLTNPKHKVERTQKNKKAESATRPNQSSDLNPIENSRQCLTNLNNLEQIFSFGDATVLQNRFYML